MLHTGHRSDFESLARRLDRTIEQVVKGHFCHFSPKKYWVPAVNAYRLADRIEVCVDLAGVDCDSVQIEAHPHEVVIRGMRQPPQPAHEPGEPIQILCMEIDHGPFERVVRLPRGVDADRMTLKADAGLLCICLPLKSTSRG